ncbi:MAG TPA: pilus assembly protein PilM [Polyangia bacterium]|nr:pilus assembly protein PilM [Polyangia bacterium]
MAHLICGIDLGTFSVKFAFLEVGFRATTLRGFVETAVPSGDAPLVERQADAVREGFAQAREATPYLAVPGDQLSVRVMQLPFADARKIDQVVGYELEGQIVHALEDVVFDHLIVAQSGENSTVLAAAAKRDDLAALIAACEAGGTHPRALYAAPVVYRALLPKGEIVEAAEGEAAPSAPCRLVLDLGHARTNVCIVRDGEPLAARTLLRGGLHLTEAISKAFEADFERAEQAKRSDARLLPAGTPPPSPLAAKLDSVLRQALEPLVRDLRQTLASFRATLKTDVSEILVTGGTGRLRDLLPFLEAELGLPAHFLAIRPVLAGSKPAAGEDTPGPAALYADESESHALASAIALTASRGTKEIDFRRGPFVYRASFSVLRQRAGHIAGLVAGILFFFGLDIYAKKSNLGDEQKDLAKQLKTATTELFGAPRDDAREITQLLKKGFKEDLAPLPKATAYDLLDQISRKTPPADKVKIDVAELEIRPKKTYIKGTVDSASAVDDLAGRLKEIECYEDITKGAITEVSGGAKQFTLTIASKCP